MRRHLVPVPFTVIITGTIFSILYAMFYEPSREIQAPGATLACFVFGAAFVAFAVYSFLLEQEERIKPTTLYVEDEEYEEGEKEIEPHEEKHRYQPMVRNSIIHITNEMGVVAAFASICNSMGYIIDQIQVKFPDAIIREISTGKLLRVEFEYESRNFKSHGHDANECDLIVCWENNYHDCPLPVIEMKEKW